ncbi:methyltransferase, partial [Campylobacter helveticus]
MKNLLGGGGCKIIQPNSSLAGLFEEKMNLIIANQSLYYLPKSVLAQNVA